MYDIYCFYLFSFFNLFRLVIGCKLANFFQDSSYCDVCQYLCWEIAILFFDLLIVIGVLVEKIYVKYENLFCEITLKLTLWSAFNPNRSLEPEQFFWLLSRWFLVCLFACQGVAIIVECLSQVSSFLPSFKGEMRAFSRKMTTRWEKMQK